MENVFKHRDAAGRGDTLKLWPYAACLCLLAYYILTTIRAYWRLHHIPGPKLAAVSNLWWVRAVAACKGHLVLNDVCEEYGSIARIGPNTLVTTDEELIRKMNAFRGSSYTKGKFYGVFKFDADHENSFSELNEEKHASMRNRVTTGYSGKDNPTMEADMDRVIWSTINLIRGKYLSNGSSLKPMDFASVAHYLTMDVITALSLGRPFGFVKEDKDMYGYVRTVGNSLPIWYLSAALPVINMVTRLQIVQKLILPSDQDRIGLGKIKMVAKEMIARRFGTDKEVRQDMTGSFIEHGLNQAEVVDETMLQLFAGSDTTAVALRTGFIAVMSNIQVYIRLRSECLNANIPISSIISNTRAVQLPYLKAVVKETLRHNPIVTSLVPKVVGPKGDIHNGVYLPAGTEIGVCAWKLNRNNTSVYGEDARVFRPERWLEASPEQLARMDKTVDLIFGNGRFRCMGEFIAKMELHKVFFEMFRRFDWSLIDPQQPLEKNENHGVFIQKGLWVRISEREM